MGFLLAVTCGAWVAGVLALAGAWRARTFLAKLRQGVLASIGVATAILLSAVVLLLHAAQVFSGKTLVAEVTARRLSGQEFELTYRPVERAQPPVTVRLEGDQWAIGGGIVKWRPWLTLLGLESRHQPQWLSGQFADLDARRTHYPSVHALRSGSDRVWEALYWADPYLPGIEAVYGSSAYAYVEPGRMHLVFVTPSGYMIARDRRREEIEHVLSP